MSYPFVNIHTHKRGNCDNISLLSLALGDDALNLQGVQTDGDESHCPTRSLFLTAGIHPWSLGRLNQAQRAELLATLAQADIVGIGEIGLDFAVAESVADRDLQIGVFEAQLEIAICRELPVIIHCVRALQQTITILRKRIGLKAVIFHGFTGSSNQLKEIIKLGYYISLSDRSLGSQKTVDAAHNMPTEKLFLETDAAHEQIENIYALASQKLGIEPQILKKTIYKNYKTLFE